MVVRIPTRLISLNRRVCILYKKWLRHLEGECKQLAEYRFKSAFCRRDFDYIINQNDPRIMKKLLLEKEEELVDTFVYDPIPFPTSPEGTKYQTHLVCDDWVLDMWHPFEKAQYPEYFAKRELRKLQYIQLWEKQHGPPPPSDD